VHSSPRAKCQGFPLRGGPIRGFLQAGALGMGQRKPIFTGDRPIDRKPPGFGRTALATRCKSNTACRASGFQPTVGKKLHLQRQFRGQSSSPKASSFPESTCRAAGTPSVLPHKLFDRSSMRHDGRPSDPARSNDLYPEHEDAQSKHHPRDPVPVVRRTAPATCPQVLGGRGYVAACIDYANSNRTGCSVQARLQKICGEMAVLFQVHDRCGGHPDLPASGLLGCLLVPRDRVSILDRPPPEAISHQTHGFLSLRC
jgi:hypothetical protein